MVSCGRCPSDHNCSTEPIVTYSHLLILLIEKVLEIITLRKDGLRGQAWVIMDDVQSATAALQAENGISFFGRELMIQYSKEVSDRISKRDGTYVSKSKRRKMEPTTNHDTLENNPQPGFEHTHETDATTTTTTTIATILSSTPPSHILLTQDLPEDVSLDMLKILFHQYAGYKDVRLPRPGLAFIEFESEPHATLALKALNGFQLTSSKSLQLDYGKV